MSTQDDGIIHMTSTPLVEKTTKADDVIMSHDNHVRLQLYDNKPPSGMKSEKIIYVGKGS